MERSDRGQQTVGRLDLIRQVVVAGDPARRFLADGALERGVRRDAGGGFSVQRGLDVVQGVLEVGVGGLEVVHRGLIGVGGCKAVTCPCSVVTAACRLVAIPLSANTRSDTAGNPPACDAARASLGPEVMAFGIPSERAHWTFATASDEERYMTR